MTEQEYRTYIKGRIKTQRDIANDIGISEYELSLFMKDNSNRSPSKNTMLKIENWYLKGNMFPADRI